MRRSGKREVKDGTDFIQKKGHLIKEDADRKGASVKICIRDYSRPCVLCKAENHKCIAKYNDNITRQAWADSNFT